jgi:hypothetical protein
MVTVTALEQERITDMQMRIPRRPVVLRNPRDHFRAARWWRLESMRGYASSAESAQYARNLRWAGELAMIHGPGKWAELSAIARSAAKENKP